MLSELLGCLEPAHRDQSSGRESWRVEPDFLRSQDGEVEPEPGKLAYFERSGWNAAVIAVGATAWYLLLLNAYPGRAAYDPAWIDGAE